jgi:hypothetical protein
MIAFLKSLFTADNRVNIKNGAIKIYCLVVSNGGEATHCNPLKTKFILILKSGIKYLYRITSSSIDR